MPTSLTRGSVPAIAQPTGLKVVRRLCQAVWFLQAAVAVATERRRLARLDDRLLKDIGLSRSTAEREIGREFLDVPAHRVRRR
ncbi:MAG: DUF1127 domain-containing protein [Hyphomicrobiaceae bacterium]